MFKIQNEVILGKMSRILQYDCSNEITSQDLDIHPRVMKLFCKPTPKQKLLKYFVTGAINLYKI